MDLSPGSSRGPERAFAGWMVSVFIGNSILAWGDLECGGSATAFGIAAAASKGSCGRHSIHRKSGSGAPALQRACTRGQFFRGTPAEIRVKDKEGRLRIIGRERCALEVVRRSHVTA